ncbi:MAG: hypothetical protein JWL83_1543, partial [Actinomycetia bacterium]|nr:hypothetical protein [Actinomycetes bacterium]
PWPLAAYTRMPFQLTQVEQAPQCDVLVQVGGAGTDLIPRLRSRYTYSWSNHGLVVLSQVPRSQLLNASRTR